MLYSLWLSFGSELPVVAGASRLGFGFCFFFPPWLAGLCVSSAVFACSAGLVLSVAASAFADNDADFFFCFRCLPFSAGGFSAASAAMAAAGSALASAAPAAVAEGSASPFFPGDGLASSVGALTLEPAAAAVASPALQRTTIPYETTNQAGHRPPVQRKLLLRALRLLFRGRLLWGFEGLDRSS